LFKSSFSSIDWLATIRAELKYILTPTKVITLFTSQGSITTRLTTINTDVGMFFFPFLALFFRPHNTILTGYCPDVNQLKGSSK